MQRILCSDWLPERARWSDTARSGLPVLFLHKENKNVHDFQEHILQQKPENTLVKSQSNMTAWNAI